jgi:hypothetical protein
VRRDRQRTMPARRFPPLWLVEDIGGCFAVKASNGRPLIFIYYRDPAGRRSLAKFLTRKAAPRIGLGVRSYWESPEIVEERSDG